ncbi:N-acyl homoserine lactonase family protein [Ktedonosporobacter rubrisoli]|uniref:N-acyl homoserine lactonase family protein n=2 Tax=Ktedonosporobacter rubrisoli TaxID=2509675 RepID=A0A4P6K4S9_KTERU|nr:N-acyl homoserine lactonase family protein [Ktedonosporobacter rubrisoli]
MTSSFPSRLYLLELAHLEDSGIPFPGYLVQTSDGTNILIDTGWPQERIGAYKQPGGTGLHMDEADFVVHRLATLGLRPSDINVLICTHLDPDHAGNHDAFPEAELVVQREHYEFAKASSDSRFLVNRQHWDHPSLRYRLIDGDMQLLPGIDLIKTSGHCPGHQSVLVRLPETGPVLLTIDAIPSQADLDPEQRALSPYDMDEAGVRASTRKLVEIARRERVTLIIHGHDPIQWKTLKRAPDYYL